MANLMAKSEKEQERIDFLNNFPLTEEVIKLIETIDAPDEDENIPLAAQDERSFFSAEQNRAYRKLHRLINAHTVQHLIRLEEEGKESHYTLEELFQALRQALDLLRRKK